MLSTFHPWLSLLNVLEQTFNKPDANDDVWRKEIIISQYNKDNMQGKRTTTT